MVVIYGMDYCKYCTSAKQLCEMKGLEYEYLDAMNHITYLEEHIGTLKSVPQIFVDGVHVGGYAEFKESV